MATLTGTRGTPTFPIGGFGDSSNLKVAWGSYTFAVNPTAADIVNLCWVPKNARVLGGYVQAKDLDTGTEALDIDIGWLANGSDAADPDGFGNLGTWTGDAITDLRPEVGIYYPLGGVLFTTGPQKFAEDTVIAATVNTPANATGTGIMTAVVFYVIDY